MPQYRKLLIFIALGCIPEGFVFSQKAELVGLELARFPKGLDIGNVSEAGTRMQFFVRDTAVVTGLTTTYKLEQWVTNVGDDLHGEHQKVANAAVQQNYQMARDTALLSERGFWPEKGKGFVFRFHSWAFPDSGATSISLKAEIEYTVLASGETSTEDITHLAGNIDGLTGFEFKGNRIDLKQKIQGQGEDAYMMFSGTVANTAYNTTIQSVEFLDSNEKVMDALYFGFNNSYTTNTRNRTDLRKAAIIRVHYRNLKTKKVRIDETCGLGF
ncbi:MAG: hypothetical protein AAF039_07350 [Bacteroidota bacterium]